MESDKISSRSIPETFTFVWKIENFFESFLFLNFCGFSSPEFITKTPFVVEWKLELRKYVKGEEIVFFYLKTGSAFFPSFLLDYEISVYGGEGKLLHTVNGRDTVKYHVDGTEAVSIGPIQVSQMKDLKRHVGESCTVQCDLTVHPHDSSLAEQDLVALSDDMAWLLKTGQLSDVELRCKKKTFHVHKCILLARASFLAAHFGISGYDTPCPLTVKVRGMKRSVLQHVLSYLYSGKVMTRDPHVLEKLEKIAENFAIHDLKKLLCPSTRKYVACTKLPKLTFQWAIKGFNSNKNFSTSFSFRNSRLAVLVRKRRKMNKNIDLNIFLTKFSSGEPIKACVKIEAIDGEGTFHPIVNRDYYEISKKGERLCLAGEFQNLVKEETNFRLLKDGVLTLDFVIILRNGEFSSEIVQEEFSLQSAAERMENFWALGNHLFDSLHNTIDSRDILLRSTKRSTNSLNDVVSTTLQADKTILSARSPVLRDMVGNRDVVDIQEIDNETLLILLEYIYGSSCREDKMRRTLTRWKELFSCAHNLAIPSLRERCTSHMLENLSDETAVEVLRLALKHKNKRLKAVASQYICTHAEMIQKTQEWRDLARIRPGLTIRGLQHFSQ